MSYKLFRKTCFYFAGVTACLCLGATTTWGQTTGGSAAGSAGAGVSAQGQVGATGGLPTGGATTLQGQAGATAQGHQNQSVQGGLQGQTRGNVGVRPDPRTPLPNARLGTNNRPSVNNQRRGTGDVRTPGNPPRATNNFRADQLDGERIPLRTRTPVTNDPADLNRERFNTRFDDGTDIDSQDDLRHLQDPFDSELDADPFGDERSRSAVQRDRTTDRENSRGEDFFPNYRNDSGIAFPRQDGEDLDDARDRLEAERDRLNRQGRRFDEDFERARRQIDRDGDGLPDHLETNNRSDIPAVPFDEDFERARRQIDRDGDGLPDHLETNNRSDIPVVPFDEANRRNEERVNSRFSKAQGEAEELYDLRNDVEYPTSTRGNVIGDDRRPGQDEPLPQRTYDRNAMPAERGVEANQPATSREPSSSSRRGIVIGDDPRRLDERYNPSNDPDLPTDLRRARDRIRQELEWRRIPYPTTTRQ